MLACWFESSPGHHLKPQISIKLKIRQPSSPEEFKKYYKTRWEILRKPWDFPQGSEVDLEEDISFHAIAVDNNRIAGVGRLTTYSNKEGRIRYMAVADHYQSQGIGRKILAFLEKEAKDKGMRRLILNARENALQFYKKQGYVTEGDAFDAFAGIPHFKMTKDL